MKKKLATKGINIEKWLVFAVLFNVAIVEGMTAVLEYRMTQSWLLGIVAVLRM